MDFLCLVYKYLFKKKPPSHDEKFHGNRGGGQKNLFIPLPQTILEGNGVVFENFTINHGNGGWSKQNIHTPPNILEGNGAVFKNYY